MATTPNTQIPLIEQNEINGHVTYGTGSQINDLHNQAIVEAIQTAEPGSPQEGQAWIINGTPTGSNWGSDASANQVAHYYGGIWHYYNPQEGWRFYNKTSSSLFYFDGIQWTSFSAPGCYLGGTTDTFTLNTTDSKLVNFSTSNQWNWFDENSINPSTGEITVPKSGFYRVTANILGTQGNSTKEEYILLKLDISGGPSPGRIDIAFVDVTTDKTNLRQPSSTATRFLTEGEILSLYMWASASLGTFTTTVTTFEIDFTAD